jgi:hypothetical protein
MFVVAPQEDCGGTRNGASVADAATADTAPYGAA